MSRTSVRAAQHVDRERVFALASQLAMSGTVERGAFNLSFDSLADEGRACLLVAESGTEVVAYCLAFEHFAFYANGRVAWIEELFVAESVRRKGIGRCLVEAVERWAQNRKAKAVALATRRASKFYVGIGYEESATYFRKLLPGA